MRKYRLGTSNSRITIQLNTLKISGDQEFATLQGEGVTAGLPAIFLRLHLCNLSCKWCDTKYTWDVNREEYWKEPKNWSYSTAIRRIKVAWKNKFSTEICSKKRVVFTGGEPLLQQNSIVKILQSLPDWEVEIETNGTIIPKPELYNYQINCSPKLESSGNPKEKRYKPEILKLINNLPNSWFKFVVIDNKDLEEVDNIIKECNLNSNKILIMPEGSTIKEVTARELEIKASVEQYGWKITKRNQLFWFGNKRRI